MSSSAYQGQDRRQFVRIEYVTPLSYKICKKETISKLLEGYTSNVSHSGLLCNIKDRVQKDDILWLSFDRSTLDTCQEAEKRSFIYQSGIIGRVVRTEPKENGTYDVGVQFITREEKNLTPHIYPKSYFGKEEPESEPLEGDEDEQV
jgi:hypothetical protein